MASTAHNDPEMMEERSDSAEVVAEKVAKLAEMIRKSNHFVAFTGAGISTSAGIPDFRGPNGKWTRQAQGLAPVTGVTAVKALPTATHMSLVELQKQGKLKYVISQNCDGLHRQSGLPAAAISELHGNGKMEICEDCGERYFRDFKCDRMEKRFDHFTGRFCRCKGRLLNSTIDFGQNLEPGPIEMATEQSAKADLHLALGSSLTVTPACDMPKMTAKKRDGALVICNRQKTPLTDLAAFQIYADTDTVMKMVMEHLGMEVPPFRLTRRILVGLKRNGTKSQVFARAVDVHDPSLEIGILRVVDWDNSGVPHAATEETEALVAAKHGAHYRDIAGLDLKNLKLTLHFVGNYQEPPLELSVGPDFCSVHAMDFMVEFDPRQQSWTQLGQTPVKDTTCLEPLPRKHDNRYGRDHREYCINGIMRQYNKTRKEAEQQFDQRLQESVAKAQRALSTSTVRATNMSQSGYLRNARQSRLR